MAVSPTATSDTYSRLKAATTTVPSLDADKHVARVLDVVLLAAARGTRIKIW